MRALYSVVYGNSAHDPILQNARYAMMILYSEIYWITLLLLHVENIKAAQDRE